MKMPDVRNVIRDEEGDITYVVMAYRKLSRPELVQAVRVFRTQHRKKIKPGTTITIQTLHGAV